MSWEPMSQKQFEETAMALKQGMRDGNAEAAGRLGDLYYHGPNGDAKDVKAALPYWQRAVDSGDTSKANIVANTYLYGSVDIRNEKEGFRYAIIAADSVHAGSQFVVGMCYINGTYCNANRTLGKRYLEKAALQGHAKAQYCLGMEMYHDHEKDGLHWLVCAHVSGNSDATKALNNLIHDSKDKQFFESWIEDIKKYGFDPSKHPSSSSSSSSSGGGGCYVATCVYGSYDCPQVWTLRRFRDNTLASTWYGRAFIRTYYAVSPKLVKWFGHTAWFKNLWRGKLDALVRKLQSEGVEDTPYSDKIW